MEYKMNRSDSYQFTADVNSVNDMLELQTVRNAVKTINRMAKQTELAQQYRYDSGWSDVEPQPIFRYRVSVMPRGARTVHAIADGRSPRAYDSTLPIRHAERLDVYIHTVSQEIC
jgi:hypothetical protein|tara:strand:- start:556 stop:900 length:345 start_codon:yes stop_codon:yes gene_type:complete